MKKSAMVIINPTSGKEEATGYEKEIRETLKAEYEKLDIQYTKKEGDATKFAKDAGKEGYDLVVALGGDGTVNEVANGLVECENPPVFGIIPMGTVNDLSKTLNIPGKAEDAIALLTSGTRKKIDVGWVNGRYFTNVLSIGHVAKAIHDVEIEEKTKWGPLAYFLSAIQKLGDKSLFPVRVELEDRVWEGEAATVLVGLIDSLGGFKTIFSEAEVGDGVFHIIILRKFDIPNLLGMLPSVLSGDIDGAENIQYFKAKKCKISSSDKEIFESDVDGEKGPQLPLELKIFPRRLTVIAGE